MPPLLLSDFARWQVVVVTVRPEVIVPTKSKSCYPAVQFFICMITMKVYLFGLECIEIPLHRRVIIRAARFAHALDDIVLLAEFNEILRGELRALVAVEYNTLRSAGRIHCVCKGSFGQFGIDPAAIYAGNDPAVVKVYDRAVIALRAVIKEKISEVSAPFLVT